MDISASDEGDLMGLERLALTVEEAGEALGISRGLAYRLARQGDLPTVRLGRRLVVPVGQLQALLGEDPSAPAASGTSDDEVSNPAA